MKVTITEDQLAQAIVDGEISVVKLMAGVYNKSFAGKSSVMNRGPASAMLHSKPSDILDRDKAADALFAFHTVLSIQRDSELQG
jgi:hypothetical protein